MQQLVLAAGGVTTVTSLLHAGVTHPRLAKAIRQGFVVRIRRDVVVDGPTWATSKPWERHEIRARGLLMSVRRTAREPLALSHHSALAVRGLSVHGVDERVHMVATDGRKGRSAKDLVIHAGVREAWVADVAGVPAVKPQLAVLQVADTFGIEAGLVSADAGLRHRAFTRVDLQDALGYGSFAHRTVRAGRVVELADGLAESAGESRARWAMHVAGLPEPLLQHVVHDAGGMPIGRVDFYFEEFQTIVEFDGMLKYDSPQALIDEKLREDRLRRLGYQVVRLTWADLSRPGLVRQKVLQAFALHRASRPA